MIGRLQKAEIKISLFSLKEQNMKSWNVNLSYIIIQLKTVIYDFLASVRILFRLP